MNRSRDLVMRCTSVNLLDYRSWQWEAAPDDGLSESESMRQSAENDFAG